MTNTEKLNLIINEENLLLLKKRLEDLIRCECLNPSKKSKSVVLEVVMNIETYINAKKTIKEELYPIFIENVEIRANSLDFDFNEIVIELIDSLPSKNQKMESVDTYVNEVSSVFNKIIQLLNWAINEIDRIDLHLSIEKILGS